MFLMLLLKMRLRLFAATTLTAAWAALIDTASAVNLYEPIESSETIDLMNFAQVDS